MRGFGQARLGSVRGWRRWTTATLLGVAAALALPPVFALPLLLVAIPGLLLLIRGARDWRGALAAGFWFGFGYHMTGLYWITDAIRFQAARFWWLVPIAVPGVAAVLALFIAIPCAVARSARPGWPRLMVLAGSWVLGDLARQFVLTGFPWNPLGSVWELPGWLGSVLIQPAALMGAPGLTLLTVMLAGAPTLGRRGRLAMFAIFAAMVGYGVARLQSAPAGHPAFVAVLVQGAIPEGEKLDRARAVAIFERYLGLTRQGAAEARARDPGLPVVVIWPETASPFLLDEDRNARAAIAEAAGPGAVTLAGTVRWGADQRPRNSLAAIGEDGSLLALYDKWHLVPFGEYQPSWADIDVQLVPGGGFAPGPGPRTVHLPGLPPVGPLICYEAIFPGHVVDRADRPAWMVNITNDGWFGNSSGPRQHLAAARMRAVEEGLPLLRAANTGISAAFDGHGRELARLGLEVGGTAIVVPRLSSAPPTWFARYGLVIPLGMALLALLAGVVLSVTRISR